MQGDAGVEECLGLSSGAAWMPEARADNLESVPLLYPDITYLQTFACFLLVASSYLNSLWIPTKGSGTSTHLQVASGPAPLHMTVGTTEKPRNPVRSLATSAVSFHFLFSAVPFFRQKSRITVPAIALTSFAAVDCLLGLNLAPLYVSRLGMETSLQLLPVVSLAIEASSIILTAANLR